MLSVAVVGTGFIMPVHVGALRRIGVMLCDAILASHSQRKWMDIN